MKKYVESIGDKSNYISFNKYRFYEIPYLSIYNYFLISRENLYFLVLSLLQLSTYSRIGILPSYWSPSGPFSTTIPLVLCYLLELFSITLCYINDLIKTYKYNYCKYADKLNNEQSIPTKFKNIKIGDILIIKKGEIFPVDGIIIETINEKYGKICLANLNGECDIVCKESLKNFIKDEIYDIKLVNIADFRNSIKNFKAIGIINDKQYNINHEYFVPGGGINSGSNDIYFLVTEIGRNIRSYTFPSNNRHLRINFVNNHISYCLTRYFVPLLAIFCISLVYFSGMHVKSLSIIFILEKIIQSWILLNGIVPFSIKLLIIMNRNIKVYFHDNKNIEYSNITSTENYNSINRLICDKTGTITKNMLKLTHLSYNNVIYEKDEIHTYLPFDDICNIMIGLHVKDDVYNTEEDKIIGHKFLSFGTIIEYVYDKVNITHNQDSKKMKILEMNRLEFDCDRKMSSVIFKSESDGCVYIVSKGSIESVRKIIKHDNINVYDSIVDKYNVNHPYLRTIAFAYKRLDNFDITKNPQIYEKLANYQFISILGIQDELQDYIKETVDYLFSKNKQVSICTGDRKETALYIANRIGILMKNHFEFKESAYIHDIGNKTFIFSSIDVSRSIEDYDTMKKFKHFLLKSKNFVSYALLPKDKQYITNMFEAHDINVITIGDGTNDIPMLNSSTVAIAVDNGLNNNVVNNSDVSVRRFSDLISLSRDVQNLVNLNLRTSFMTYYKTLLLNSLIYFYIIHNKMDFKNILFSFIDIQGHHLVWGILPIITANLYNINDIKTSYIVKTSSLYGIMNSLLIIYFVNNYRLLGFMEPKNAILLYSILSINIQFIVIYGVNKLNIISSVCSFLLGILYMLSTGKI